MAFQVRGFDSPTTDDMSDYVGKLETMLQALFESALQAPHDFGGDQREWHCPRLAKAMTLAMTLFPSNAGHALAAAKNPYGGNAMRNP